MGAPGHPDQPVAITALAESRWALRLSALEHLFGLAVGSEPFIGHLREFVEHSPNGLSWPAAHAVLCVARLRRSQDGGHRRQHVSRSCEWEIEDVKDAMMLVGVSPKRKRRRSDEPIGKRTRSEPRSGKDQGLTGQLTPPCSSTPAADSSDIQPAEEPSPNGANFNDGDPCDSLGHGNQPAGPTGHNADEIDDEPKTRLMNHDDMLEETPQRLESPPRLEKKHIFTILRRLLPVSHALYEVAPITGKLSWKQWADKTPPEPRFYKTGDALVPIFDERNKHWVLVHLDRPLKTIYFYDTCQSLGSEDNMRCAAEAVLQAVNSDGEDQKWSFVAHKLTVPQADRDPCGFFTVVAALSIAAGCKLPQRLDPMLWTRPFSLLFHPNTPANNWSPTAPDPLELPDRVLLAKNRYIQLGIIESQINEAFQLFSTLYRKHQTDLESCKTKAGALQEQIQVRSAWLNNVKKDLSHTQRKLDSDLARDLANYISCSKEELKGLLSVQERIQPLSTCAAQILEETRSECSIIRELRSFAAKRLEMLAKQLVPFEAVLTEVGGSQGLLALVNRDD